ncbi:MnhB domain-containing protein [Natrarchaeobaculum aegyptiacum]|uniref:Pesticidal protein Cry4Aa n=1 Tax=Natrarchaeobaculum aegyptiacum TaxID=745377 RepID=A0A2Z2HPJ5_9EURY|nr:MnhB domain-containing protein [Natrarchaeobaculum aegyptiacum]ARS88950.1 pesticidal protein Cry4Aa [Natrarchaeobaculum aegyptiacum]
MTGPDRRTNTESETEEESTADGDGGDDGVDAAENPSTADVADADDLERLTDVTESPVVTTASRTITPFVVAFGIYLTLFGTSLPGGAFQGGVVMASTVVLVAMAFGFGPTREWLDERALAGLFVLGAGIFGVVAFGAVVLGGDVLELFVFPLTVEDMVKLVEVAIAALVAGVIIGLFVWLAAGFGEGGDSI